MRDASVAFDPQVGTTLTFVMSMVRLDTRLTSGGEVLETSLAKPHSGFNLDDRLSDYEDERGCLVPDYFSKYEPEGQRVVDCNQRRGCIDKNGVDNAFLSIADATASGIGSWNDVFKKNIADREMVVLVRVVGVNSLSHDGDVTVKLYNAHARFAPPCESPVPDQEYTIAGGSLRPGSVDIEESLVQLPGRIESGRLIASSKGPFVVSMRIAGQKLDAVWQDPHMGIDLCSDGVEGIQGNFGVWMRGSDLLNLFTRLDRSHPELWASLVPQFLDMLDPSLSSTPMQQCIMASPTRPEQWGGLSAGFEIALLRARLASTVPSVTPPVGACGAVVSTDAGMGDASDVQDVPTSRD